MIAELLPDLEGNKKGDDGQKAFHPENRYATTINSLYLRRSGQTIYLL